MARLAGKARGDMRAMEEQMERHNPVRGGAAVPSMGLSQFRGGRRVGDSDSGSGSESDENEQMVGGSHVVGGRRRLRLRRNMVGSGMCPCGMEGCEGCMVGGGPIFDFVKKYGSKFLKWLSGSQGNGPQGHAAQEDELAKLGITDKKSFLAWARKNHPDRGGDTAVFQRVLAQAQKAGFKVGQGRPRKGGGMGEATQMGLHLGKHLHSLHGAGWFDDFKSGFNSVIAPVAGVAKSVLPLLGPEGMAASGVINALGYGRRRRRGGASNSDTGAYEGHGRERDDMAMLGMGTGAGLLGENGHGIRMGGRRRRAPAGPSDGRRRRAEIVKRVMAERGLSMIEASKAVKAEGLY